MGSSSAVQNPESGVVRIAVEDLAAHLATLEVELSGLRAIELMRGETVIAKILPPEPVAAGGKVEMPDFMARLRENWGDTPRNFDTTAWIREDRDGNFLSPISIRASLLRSTCPKRNRKRQAKSSRV